MVTLAKRENLHARRQVLSMVPDTVVVGRLFDTIAARFADRHGGYTRIIRVGPRPGDAAPMVSSSWSIAPETPADGDKDKAKGKKKAERAPKGEASAAAAGRGRKPPPLPPIGGLVVNLHRRREHSRHGGGAVSGGGSPSEPPPRSRRAAALEPGLASQSCSGPTFRSGRS